MSKQTEALKLALEAMGLIGADLVCEAAHHEKADRHGISEPCPVQARWHHAFAAIREALAEQDDPDLQDKDPELVERHYKQVVDGVREMFDAKRKQPAQQQEPVAVYVGETWCGSVVRLYEDLPLETPLYTSPPASKPWVGLTDEDFNTNMFSITSLGVCDIASMKSIAKDVEAKLREKNA